MLQAYGSHHGAWNCGESLPEVLKSLSSSFHTDCPGVIALAKSEAEKLKVEEKEESKQPEAAPKEDETGEAPIDPNRNWNWKTDEFKYSPYRVESNPTYIGSYAMDGLAMALHILWTTTSFSEAILKAVNLRGDADTVAAIVGQIAGCFYGCSQIPNEWKECVAQWDNHEIALRALRLFDHLLLTEA